MGSPVEVRRVGGPRLFLCRSARRGRPRGIPRDHTTCRRRVARQILQGHLGSPLADDHIPGLAQPRPDLRRPSMYILGQGHHAEKGDKSQFSSSHWCRGTQALQPAGKVQWSAMDMACTTRCGRAIRLAVVTYTMSWPRCAASSRPRAGQEVIDDLLTRSPTSRCGW